MQERAASLVQGLGMRSSGPLETHRAGRQVHTLHQQDAVAAGRLLDPLCHLRMLIKKQDLTSECTQMSDNDGQDVVAAMRLLPLTSSATCTCLATARLRFADSNSDNRSGNRLLLGASLTSNAICACFVDSERQHLTVRIET